jgi:hypothetical protein
VFAERQTALGLTVQVEKRSSAALLEACDKLHECYSGEIDLDTDVCVSDCGTSTFNLCDSECADCVNQRTCGEIWRGCLRECQPTRTACAKLSECSASYLDISDCVETCGDSTTYSQHHNVCDDACDDCIAETACGLIDDACTPVCTTQWDPNAYTGPSTVSAAEACGKMLECYRGDLVLEECVDGCGTGTPFALCEGACSHCVLETTECGELRDTCMTACGA